MPTTAWKSASPIDRDTQYAVVSTQARLRRRRDLPRFAAIAQTLWADLEAADGLIGYTLRAALLRNTLTTISAWRDLDAMNVFAQTSAHRRAVDLTRPLVTDSRITSTTATGRELLARFPHSAPVTTDGRRSAASAAS